MTATTSKLGADMTDEQREAIESGIAAMEKCGWTHRVPVLRALLARQPAAIDKEAVALGEGFVRVGDVMKIFQMMCVSRVMTPNTQEGWLAALQVYAVPEASEPAAPSVEQDERERFDKALMAYAMEFSESIDAEKIRVAHKRVMDLFESRAASTSANVAQLDMSLEARLTDAEADVKRLHAEKMELWNQVHGYSANVAQGAEAVTEDISLVRELQKALFYWMPRIAGEDSPAGHKAAEHAYLLIGLDDNSTECYGDQARSSLGIVNRELERIGIACSDAGCPDEMEVADFIADLYARAQAAATVASTDDARECLADVVSHYRALYAGLAFQLNEAAVIEDSDDMTYWKHEIKALERMYAQAERALTAAPPAQTALTVTPAMVKAAIPWLTGLHHMRNTDAKAHIEEAIKAALTAAQSASGDTK